MLVVPVIRKQIHGPATGAVVRRNESLTHHIAVQEPNGGVSGAAENADVGPSVTIDRRVDISEVTSPAVDAQARS